MLYTILMEYRGGTYGSQVDAHTPISAVQKWASALDPMPIQGLDQARKVELINTMDSDLSCGIEPTLLEGLINVWCTSVSISGSFMLINVVATIP